MNRKAVGNMIGDGGADNEVAEFYKDIEEIPPWLVTLREQKQLMEWNQAEVGL